MKFGDFEEFRIDPSHLCISQMHTLRARISSQSVRKNYNLRFHIQLITLSIMLQFCPEAVMILTNVYFYQKGWNGCMLQQQTFKIHKKILSIWYVCLRSLNSTFSPQPEISNFMQANVDLPNFLNSSFLSNTHYNATFRFFNARILLYVPCSSCQRILCYKWEVGMDLFCIPMKYFFLSIFSLQNCGFFSI